MKAELKKLIIKGMIGFAIGFFIVNGQDPDAFGQALLMGILFAGVPHGWFVARGIFGGLYVVGSLPVMVTAFVLRLIVALIIGWIVYPVALIRTIVNLSKETKHHQSN